MKNVYQLSTVEEPPPTHTHYLNRSERMLYCPLTNIAPRVSTAALGLPSLAGSLHNHYTQACA